MLNCKRIFKGNSYMVQIIISICIITVFTNLSLCRAVSVSSDDSDSNSSPDEGGVYMPLLSDPCTAESMVSLDFDQADIRVFIKTIGHLTGINFLIDDNVRGSVTLISPTKIHLSEVYKILESVLEVKGYAAVPAGKIVKMRK